ncbi:hypothetical protein LZ30DRAFT_701983 [Colletotrichum cereale]|nr:hypothetical protein LZ30DRAFT_701983 [Colletotrichum cereale]
MMNKLIIALAMVSAATAAPALDRRSDCQDAYKVCIAAGTPMISCQCTLTACLGEDNARARDFCATATGNLTQPTPTGTPPAASTSAPPSSTSMVGVPGGCNPAHPGSCPSSSSSVPTTSSTAPPTATPTSPPDDSIPEPVDGEMWTIKAMNRYCGAGGDGCDYNFDIEADGKTEHCTIVRRPVASAATESWYDQPCAPGSEFNITWNYVDNPTPAYAIVAVVKGQKIAWFGITDVNGKPVTPSNPFGSGQFGDLGPQQVYSN